MREALLLLAALVLSGCASQSGAPDSPFQILTRDHLTDQTASPADQGVLRVMTYNVAGLPAPVRTGRKAALAEIGDRLAGLREAGEAPQIVFLQEAFMDEPTQTLIRRAGYAFAVRGPDKSHAPAPRLGALGAPRRARGEGLGKLTGSGLYILSDYPVLDVRAMTFGDCAGLDCLANKGVLMARIQTPFSPEPVEVFTTHLNARKASKAPIERAHLAHQLQMTALKAFLAKTLRPGAPLIYGGDFNMRRSTVRLDHAAPAAPYAFARAVCQTDGARCDLTELEPEERTVLSTQDLQGFREGDGVTIRPVRLKTFWSEFGPAALSDHSAYAVDYRLERRDRPRLILTGLMDPENGEVFMRRGPQATQRADNAGAKEELQSGLIAASYPAPSPARSLSRQYAAN